MSASMPFGTPRTIHPWVAESERRVRFGVYFVPGADWRSPFDVAQAVETLGFDSIWFPDHPLYAGADCWTTLAAVAARTERLRLGSLVSCIYYRSPGLLARMAADVDCLSDGRLVLGLGFGDFPTEFQQLGLTFPPLAERTIAMTETVALVRGLWRGEAMTLHGSFVHTDDTRLATVPVQQPHVPILIAGGGERVTLRRVAEHADMCNFGPHSAAGSAWRTMEVRRKLDVLTEHCLAIGRPPEAVLRSHFCWRLIIGETPTAVDDRLGREVRGRLASEPKREEGMARLVQVEGAGVTVTYVAGTPPEVAAYFQELIEAGMHYFIVGCFNDPKMMRLLSEQVLPQLRS